MITKLAIILPAVLARRSRSVSPAQVISLNSVRRATARRPSLTCRWKADPVTGRLSCVWFADVLGNAEDEGPSRRFVMFSRPPRSRACGRGLLAA